MIIYVHLFLLYTAGTFSAATHAAALEYIRKVIGDTPAVCMTTTLFYEKYLTPGAFSRALKTAITKIVLCRWSSVERFYRLSDRRAIRKAIRCDSERRFLRRSHDGSRASSAYRRGRTRRSHVSSVQSIFSASRHYSQMYVVSEFARRKSDTTAFKGQREHWVCDRHWQ